MNVWIVGKFLYIVFVLFVIGNVIFGRSFELGLFVDLGFMV